MIIKVEVKIIHRSHTCPRRVLKYRLKIRGSIYLFLSVGRKMTPFPETVSDPNFQAVIQHSTRTTRFGSLTVSGNGVIFLPTLKNKLIDAKAPQDSTRTSRLHFMTLRG